MTRKQWIIMLLVGLASAILFFVLTRLLTGATDRTQAVAPRGPWLWDLISIVAGIALGTVLRIGLNRQSPSTTRIVIGIVVLVFLGVLTFIPWSNDSPVRSVVLPVMELLTAAYATVGTTSNRQQ